MPFDCSQLCSCAVINPEYTAGPVLSVLLCCTLTNCHLTCPFAAAVQAGFSHDYNSVNKDEPEYDHLLRVLPRCFTEVMLRIANPLRPLFPTAFRYGHKGTAAFAAFQAEMNALLKGLEARGEPAADDTDIGTQLLRVMKEHPNISRDRVLSEIGILFVEGFETTGGRVGQQEPRRRVWTHRGWG